MKRLDNKVALITGAGSGIGRATAKRLAEEGAFVAVLDINDDGGQATCKDIQSTGGTAKFWHMDISNENLVQSVFQQIHEELSKIDILVNNAAYPGSSDLTEESTEENWQKVFNVTAKGPFLCTKHVIPYMRENGGGSIVNIASIDALRASGQLSNYHSAKGAIISMTIQDAASYAKDNIRVNVICPGIIKTEAVYEYADAHPELGGIEGLEAIFSAPTSMKRLGKPEEIANGVLFFASDESSYCTGAKLVIDGGTIIKYQ